MYGARAWMREEASLSRASTYIDYDSDSEEWWAFYHDCIAELKGDGRARFDHLPFETMLTFVTDDISDGAVTIKPRAS